jgi:hypothetical protein
MGGFSKIARMETGMITPTTPSEQLLFMTVRISAELPGGLVSTGTGFFFDYAVSVELPRLSGQ